MNPLQGSLAGWPRRPALRPRADARLLDRAGLRGRQDAAVRCSSSLPALGVGVAVYGLFQTSSGFPGWDRHWISDVSLRGPQRQRRHPSLRDVQLGCRSTASSSALRSSSGSPWASRLVVPAVHHRRRSRCSSRRSCSSPRAGPSSGLSRRSACSSGAYRGLPLALSAGVGVLLLVALVVGSASLRSEHLRHRHDQRRTPLTPGSGSFRPLNPQTSTARHPPRDDPERAQGGLHAASWSGSRHGHHCRRRSSEGSPRAPRSDPSNVAVALGLPGLSRTWSSRHRDAPRVRDRGRRRDGLALAALGVVTLTALQWLNGGQYAVAVLPWLVLGWADRPRMEPKNTVDLTA